MTMKTRLLSLLSVACVLFNADVAAQDYPVKPIRIIVPLAAGGGTDLLARVIAAKLRDKFGQPVTVENRSCAAGNIGADAVFKAPPDGYTLLFTSNSAHVGLTFNGTTGKWRWSAIGNAVASLAPGKIPPLDAPATPEAIMRAVKAMRP